MVEKKAELRNLRTTISLSQSQHKGFLTGPGKQHEILPWPHKRFLQSPRLRGQSSIDSLGVESGRCRSCVTCSESSSSPSVSSRVVVSEFREASTGWITKTEQARMRAETGQSHSKKDCRVGESVVSGSGKLLPLGSEHVDLMVTRMILLSSSSAVLGRLHSRLGDEFNVEMFSFQEDEVIGLWSRNQVGEDVSKGTCSQSLKREEGA